MSLVIDTENVISSGIDGKTRRIFFGRYLPNADADLNTDFDSVSVEYAIRGIHEMIASAPKKPIEIHMSSYGGNPYLMLYLHDLILSSPCQFKFYGGGAIMSAATWIMAACDERYLYKHTTVMVHKGSTALEGNMTDVEIGMEEEKRLQDLLEEIYANNSRMPKSFWAEVCKRDLYLTAEEAVTFGLADKIIEPKKRGEFRKMRQEHLKEKMHHKTLQKVISKVSSRIHMPNLKEITINLPVVEPIDETPQIVDTPIEPIVEPKKGANVSTDEKDQGLTVEKIQEAFDAAKEAGMESPAVVKVGEITLPEITAPSIEVKAEEKPKAEPTVQELINALKAKRKEEFGLSLKDDLELTKLRKKLTAIQLQRNKFKKLLNGWRQSDSKAKARILRQVSVIAKTLGHGNFELLQNLYTTTTTEQKNEKGEITVPASSEVNYKGLLAEAKNAIVLEREARIKKGLRKRSTGRRSDRKSHADAVRFLTQRNAEETVKAALQAKE